LSGCWHCDLFGPLMDQLFKLSSTFKPAGDQPEAIEALCRGVSRNERYQVLEGVTGSGKTFTIANVIAHANLPTIIMSHNKTLAAQLYGELKAFFPENAVEFFISYYDYYQPEAYIPQTDTHIEKDASINAEIERMRLSATNSILERKDVIVIASVSCIYGLGSPADYREMAVQLREGVETNRDDILARLVAIQYTRNDYETEPATFRARGDTIDIFPSYSTTGIRVEFWGDTVNRISRIEPLTGNVIGQIPEVLISPAKHFVMPDSKLEAAEKLIRAEMEDRVKWFETNGKLLEAQRIKMRTMFDIEMMRAMGYCSGIENYSRHLSGRAAGQPPATLFDYFPKPFLTFIDESHATVPQLRAMYNGDQSRKRVLVDYGFRLPSAMDNRPLSFQEFLNATGQVIFTTATPGPFEREVSPPAIQQIVRPTGLIDPVVEIRPSKGQIDNLMEEVRARAVSGERVLISTLTKRTAEDLTDYLANAGLRVRYLHSDISALDRVEILHGLRKSDFDCVVGINLLREGLDLPEVSMVAILDADKEGFLRSETSLLQTAGRTARHINGKVVLYADSITDSMRGMMSKTDLRRSKQLEYNRLNKISPKSIKKELSELFQFRKTSEEIESRAVREIGEDYDVHEVIRSMKAEMVEAAEALEYERAAILRDQIHELEQSSKARNTNR